MKQPIAILMLAGMAYGQSDPCLIDLTSGPCLAKTQRDAEKTLSAQRKTTGSMTYFIVGRESRDVWEEFELGNGGTSSADVLIQQFDLNGLDICVRVKDCPEH